MCVAIRLSRKRVGENKWRDPMEFRWFNVDIKYHSLREWAHLSWLFDGRLVPQTTMQWSKLVDCGDDAYVNYLLVYRSSFDLFHSVHHLLFVHLFLSSILFSVIVFASFAHHIRIVVLAGLTRYCGDYLIITKEDKFRRHYQTIYFLASTHESSPKFRTKHAHTNIHTE